MREEKKYQGNYNTSSKRVFSDFQLNIQNQIKLLKLLKR